MKYLILIIVLLVAGCSSMPPVDPATTNMAKYKQDYEYCEFIASQHTNVEQSAAGGALLGAGLMAAGSAILGGDVKQWAALGGMTGAVHGGAAGMLKKDDIIADCLEGRGYNILGRR